MSEPTPIFHRAMDDAMARYVAEESEALIAYQWNDMLSGLVGLLEEASEG